MAKKKKTIILVHGRSYKPPKASLKRLWVDALRAGLERDHPSAVASLDAVTLEFVYYGDISNAFLARRDGIDPNDLPNDTASRRTTLNDLKARPKADFGDEAVYDHLPGKSAVGEALADALGGVLAFLHVSGPLIEAVAPDMREYWNEDTAFGSAVREPMIAPLKRALNSGNDVMVIAHSLGTLISYDTFWKFCHYSEYRDQFGPAKKIDTWITIGSPLGDETVKMHLKGAGASGARRYPANVGAWINIAAEDDFVSHDQRVADDYREMEQFGLVDRIADHRIYNLSLRDGKSNPHHEGGYLIHPLMSDILASWLS